MTNSISIEQTKLSFAFLFSGLALLVYIYTGLPLFLSLLLFFAPGLYVYHKTSQQLHAAEKKSLNKDVRNGVYIGILGTLVYDTVRLALYSSGAVKFFPFETFHLFGNALTGAIVSYNVAFAVGAFYHLLNGIAFSVAYRISCKNRNFIWGIVGAMGLEILMLIAYSSWLNLADKMTDFLTISMAGHFSYGATVGLLNQYRFRSKE